MRSLTAVDDLAVLLSHTTHTHTYTHRYQPGRDLSPIILGYACVIELGYACVIELGYACVIELGYACVIE
jgi:hypothetical protein